MNAQAQYFGGDIVQASVADLFGLPIPHEVMIDVLPKTQLVPRKTDDYRFRPNMVKLLLAFFLNLKDSTGGLYLHGGFGTGKTSLIQETCARLNWPLVSFEWNYESEVEDLIGRHEIQFGDTAFKHGPLALAMRHGYALLINEIDRGRSGNLTALHGVLEGYPLHIPETGEIIEPHPNFRLIFTANSAGTGDRTGNYTGSVRQLDAAFMDRCLVLKCDYLPEVEEIEMLMRRFPSASGVLVSALVQFAGRTRAQATDMASSLTIPLSTRALIRFLDLAQCFGLHTQAPALKDVEKLLPALGPAYLDRLEDDARTAALDLLKLSFSPKP